MAAASRFRRFDLGNKAIEGIFDNSVVGGIGESFSSCVVDMKAYSANQLPPAVPLFLPVVCNLHCFTHFRHDSARTHLTHLYSYKYLVLAVCDIAYDVVIYSYGYQECMLSLASVVSRSCLLSSRTRTSYSTQQCNAMEHLTKHHDWEIL